MHLMSDIVELPEAPPSTIPAICPVCGRDTMVKSRLGEDFDYRQRCDHDPVEVARMATEAHDKAVTAEVQRMANRADLVGKLYRGGFSTFRRDKQPEAFDVVLNYAKNPTGWLFLTGEVGTGKTHLMAAAVIEIERGFNEARGNGVRQASKMVNVSDLMAECRNAIGADGMGDPIETYKSVGLLALDDLGIQKRTDWTDENIYRIFDYRLRNELPMIVTSNFTVKEIAAWPGWERIADRIVEAAKIIRLRPGSYRQSARAKMPRTA
jgi:DNA replication protein DnaC